MELPAWEVGELQSSAKDVIYLAVTSRNTGHLSKRRPNSKKKLDLENGGIYSVYIDNPAIIEFPERNGVKGVDLSKERIVKKDQGIQNGQFWKRIATGAFLMNF